MTDIDLPSIRELLRDHGLSDVPEEPFANDGWSGAQLTRLRHGGGDRFILKRDSLARDWIARATSDGPVLREAWFATQAQLLDERVDGRLRAPYLGAGRDGDEFATLMPDLSDVLFDWSRPISVEQLDHVLSALAAMHGALWGHDPRLWMTDPAHVDRTGPWCPLPERISLISRVTLEKDGPARDAVAERLLPGWDAFDRQAARDASELIAQLALDPRPLLDTLDRLPTTLIHGDLKLANVGIAADRAVDVVDWQMVSLAPIAIELGWFLVSNVASLPIPPDEVISQYQAKLSDLTDRGGVVSTPMLDQPDIDAAILVGLLLRGWRKGFDAESGVTLASGVSAADDLAWWCERAVQAADRLF